MNMNVKDEMGIFQYVYPKPKWQAMKQAKKENKQILIKGE